MDENEFIHRTTPLVKSALDRIGAMWSDDLDIDFTDEYQKKLNYYHKMKNFQLYERTLRKFEKEAHAIAEKRFNEIREIKASASPADLKFMNQAFELHHKNYHKFRAASMAYSELKAHGRKDTPHAE